MKWYNRLIKLQSHDKDIQAQATYIFENQGKLLRPKFALLLAKALLGSENDTSDKLYKVKVWSAVVEIIHNSSLLQDDIIDEASLRRGRPTAHTLFGVTNTSILPLYIVGRA
jgi:geranylgeranyl pyrophosphate synthase